MPELLDLHQTFIDQYWSILKMSDVTASYGMSPNTEKIYSWNSSNIVENWPTMSNSYYSTIIVIQFNYKPPNIQMGILLLFIYYPYKIFPFFNFKKHFA